MEQEYKYIVVTRCFTFNHALYIEDAMNGFVMQETSFPVVTLIVDDASTDGEPEVIRKYIADHFQSPYRTEETEYANIICAKHKTNANCDFVVFFLKYNHYSIKKTKMPYLSEWLDNAKYHALCEGDDYWTDLLKLQKQVDFMESHPDCSLCYSSTKVYNQESQSFLESSLGEPCDSIENLLKKNVVPTLTCLIRQQYLRGYYEEIKPMSRNWSLGDYPIWLWLAAKGVIHFFSEQMGVYRKMTGSASHPTSVKKFKKLINDANDIAILFDQKFNQGKLTGYREHLRYRGLMSIEANYNHSIRGVYRCFSKMPHKTANDVIYLCKSLSQIGYYRLFMHHK